MRSLRVVRWIRRTPRRLSSPATLALTVVLGMPKRLAAGCAAFNGGKPYGTLKVTASVDLGQAVLPRIARAYAAKYPDVSLEFIVTNRTVDLVEEGVDLAIRWARAMKDSSLIARRFFEARSSLWASPKCMQGLGKTTHPRDLANAAFVTHPLVKGSVVLTNGKSEFEVQRKVGIHADALETIKALIVLGEGIAGLPDFVTADAAKAGKLVRVLPQWRPKQQEFGTCYFVYAGRQYVLPKVECFIQTALEMFGGTGEQRRGGS